MTRRVTITDVAERAGVSKTTVSHVVNNTRYVEEETRQRVQKAIDEFGFRPSLAARSLTTNRTETLGVIVSDISNNFFGEVIRGIEDIAGPKNYGLVVCDTDEILERENHYLELLLRQRVDGLIAAAASQRWEALGTAEVQHTPIVFVDRTFEGMDGPFVGADNEGGGYLGTRYLLGCRHTNLGILPGFQRLSTMRDRLAGFRRALAEAEVPLCPEWVIESPLGIEEGRTAARHLLGQTERPTALFINNNLLSLGTLLALEDLGLHCPQDVAIVGFDDHPWSAVSCPPLTVVRQPARRLGQVAAEMIFALINHEELPNQRVALPCELIIRQSC